jgi:hypothetical protein
MGCFFYTPQGISISPFCAKIARIKRIDPAKILKSGAKRGIGLTG